MFATLFLVCAAAPGAAPTFEVVNLCPAVEAAPCCPCGGGCTCPVGACPGGCPDALFPVSAPPSSACYQDAAGNWICPVDGHVIKAAGAQTPAKAAVVASAGACSGGGFFTDSGPRHPLRAAAHAVGQWVSEHRPHVFQGRHCR